MSVPQWKRDRCNRCAEGAESMPHGSARMHYFTFGSVKPFVPAKPSVLCTAPTEAEYIAELELFIGDPFAHFEYLWKGIVLEDDSKLDGVARQKKARLLEITGVTAIAHALGLPVSATPEQCVERAGELRKDGERLDWLEASEGEVSREMVEDDPNDEDTDVHSGWACYTTPLTADEKRRAVSATANTLRAALDAARGEKP